MPVCTGQKGVAAKAKMGAPDPPGREVKSKVSFPFKVGTEDLPRYISPGILLGSRRSGSERAAAGLEKAMPKNLWRTFLPTFVTTRSRPRLCPDCPRDCRLSSKANSLCISSGPQILPWMRCSDCLHQELCPGWLAWTQSSRARQPVQRIQGRI